jgi:hypothetical protein
MTEESAVEVFDVLSALLAELGFAWVVKQVLEEVSSGSVKEVLLKDELPLQELSMSLFSLERQESSPERVVFERRSAVRKKSNTRYLKVSEYSFKERLELLIDGVDKAIVEGLILKQNVAVFFRKEASEVRMNSSSIEFSSEDENESLRSELHFDSCHDESAQSLRALLGSIKREISSQ